MNKESIRGMGGGQTRAAGERRSGRSAASSTLIGLGTYEESESPRPRGPTPNSTLRAVAPAPSIELPARSASTTPVAVLPQPAPHARPVASALPATVPAHVGWPAAAPRAPLPPVPDPQPVARAAPLPILPWVHPATWMVSILVAIAIGFGLGRL